MRLPLLLSTLALVALSTLMLQATAVAQQDAPARQPGAQQNQDPAASSPMNQTSNSQTFVGKITRASGKYVLKDDATQATYALDDQSQAKKFEGKSVKVSGKLDAQTNTIQVAAIEPAS